MQELRLVAVSEDGSYLVLATAGRGTRFTLPVDDRLRAAVRGHFSRLGQFEIEVESPLRPKEIQARIRAGETAEEIAESAGIPVERVRWFEGPVLQEREYMAQQAQRVAVRRPGESSHGSPLGEMVEERLGRRGIDLEDVEWDSWKCEDSTWRVRLSFFDDGRPGTAEWSFDPRRRQISPLDEEAARLCSLVLDEPVADTVTPLLPRRPAMTVVPDSLGGSASPVESRHDRTRREYIVERGRMVAPPDPAGDQDAPSEAPATPPWDHGAQGAQDRRAEDRRAEDRSPAAAGSTDTTYTADPADTDYTTGTEDTSDSADASEPAGVPGTEATEPQSPVGAEDGHGAEGSEGGRTTDRPHEPATARPPAAGETAAPPAAARPAPERPEPVGEPAEPEPADRPAAAAERPAGPPKTAEPHREEAAEAPGETQREPAAKPAGKPGKPAARPARPDRPRRRDPVERSDQPAAQVKEPAVVKGGDTTVPPSNPPARPRRKSARGKRASVPSWDEIMFGARRPD